MIKICQSNEEINSNGGNILLGRLLSNIGLEEMNQQTTERIKHGEIAHGDILKMAAMLLANGRTDFADIDSFRDDPLFKKVLNIRKVASAATCRQRLNDLSACNANQTLLDPMIVKLLRKVKDFGRIHTETAQYVPLDVDVSVMLQPNCNKENVSWTYHNAPGYAPIFGYLGTFGYMLGNELRPGSQHSAKGAVEFVQRCIQKAMSIGLKAEEILVRADSGHDDGNFFRSLHEAGVNFLVKHNLRHESLEQYLSLAKNCGVKIPSRDGKAEYRCVISHKRPVGCKDIPMFLVVEATERWTDSKGNELLFPEIEVSSWWTNLCEDEAVCIELYYEHATSEQFHSELKTDMGLESLPSGKFATNALILNLATIAYNCLRFIGQEALTCRNLLPVEINVSRRRLRSVLQDIVYVGCKLVRHANTLILKFGRNCPWFKCIEVVYARC